ncbi:YqaE/Pmp3 family membrane protein [Pontixanthobacter gangjinensis]|uniref:YqaE/Pmp3 family membrane protein n=1 Tax=Pontixanthobacter gangjinensis TaxID=1028742 RepID=A0A6I4SPT2_9SPHN|nr:YqaE/Pmp3 family membrane protein [Pontixanthobacter gangjinensis]MXO57160.1 YqaE/Pmp3 family membrane protein [Pontixanthobacter gangjinensis]
MQIIVLILSILLPPVGVAIKHGLSNDFWINLILTILGVIPGIIHALYVNFLR